MEIPNDIASLQDLVRVCLLKIATLESENAELRRRLGMNSNNSDKPPSSDGYGKKVVKRGIPQDVGKKQGGQEGHEGKTLEMVSNPDKEVVHYAGSCSVCRRKFSELDVQKVLAQKRQVFDIPIPKLEVTEHCLGEICCCGVTHKGCFPMDVSAPVQYGVNILSLGSMLSVDFRMPYAKISQLFEDLYACSLNVSTLVSANTTLYENLLPIETAIKSHLLDSEVVHFDETGMRVESKLHWFHTACNSLFSHIFVHTKRGKEALEDENSLLPKFKGRAVHDCWASYFAFKHCQHALCNAHILRELQALIDEGSVWATLMHSFLMQLYQATDKGKIVVASPQDWIKRYEQICHQANEEEPPPKINKRGKPKNTKGRNLYNRLVLHQMAVLAFALVHEIPFTNNTAEQDIRCVKIKQKVAMSFRTLEGAMVYARIQAAIKTFRKQGFNVFKTITEVNQKQTIVFRCT